MDFFVLNLKALKEAFGYTYEDLMPIFDVQSRGSIINYLAGNTTPSKGKIEDFASHVGLTYEDIIGREIKRDEAKALAIRTATKSHNTDGDHFLEGSLADDTAGGYQYKSKKEQEDYNVALAVHTGKIISMILDKHRTPREYYAKEILKRDSRTLQRICKGEIMAGFDIILKVAIDHNEPLELFRTGPMPQGHLLTQLRDKETIIDTQNQLIAQLQRA